MFIGMTLRTVLPLRKPTLVEMIHTKLVLRIKDCVFSAVSATISFGLTSFRPSPFPGLAFPASRAFAAKIFLAPFDYFLSIPAFTFSSMHHVDFR